MWALGIRWEYNSGVCFSAWLLELDPYEYIIMCFERKDTMVNKGKKATHASLFW